MTNNFTSSAQWSPATAYGYTDYNGNFHFTADGGGGGFAGGGGSFGGGGSSGNWSTKDPTQIASILKAAQNKSLRIADGSMSYTYVEYGAMVAIDGNGNPIDGTEKGVNIIYNDNIDLKTSRSLVYGSGNQQNNGGSLPASQFNANAWGMLGYILETSAHNGADDAIKLGTYTKGATNIAKGLGFGLTAVNVGLTAYTLKQEYNKGKIDTHSFVNGGVAIVTAGAAITAAIIGVATAPVWLTAIGVGGAVYGIVYGIDQISGGIIGIDTGIDNSTNHWGKQFNK